MIPYHKIQSIFKRDPANHHKTFLLDEYSIPEFEYLKDNMWTACEKIDGTNIKVNWNRETKKVLFGDKTDNTQIPVFLFAKLQELFPIDKFMDTYPNETMTLYGEGFGKRIQSGGKYIPDGVDFILFDVRMGEWWLRREDIEEIALSLGIQIVPIVYHNIRLPEIVDITRVKDTNSIFGNFLSEGFVLKPQCELLARSGKRIITKIKHKDFPDV